jgi:hypothetical protein
MSLAISNSIQLPFEQSMHYTQNYKKSKESFEKGLFEELLCATFSALASAIEKLKIEELDKIAALYELKEIDKILFRMEEFLAKNEKKLSDKINASFELFYNALDNLSCSLALYLDEESNNYLEKISNRDFSDFEVYKPR